MTKILVLSNDKVSCSIIKQHINLTIGKFSDKFKLLNAGEDQILPSEDLVIIIDVDYPYTENFTLELLKEFQNDSVVLVGVTRFAQYQDQFGKLGIKVIHFDRFISAQANMELLINECRQIERTELSEELK